MGLNSFNKLLHNLAKGQLIDLAIRDEPTDLLPNLLENAFPVDHLVKLILDVSLLLHLNFLLFHVV